MDSSCRWLDGGPQQTLGSLVIDFSHFAANPSVFNWTTISRHDSSCCAKPGSSWSGLADLTRIYSAFLSAERRRERVKSSLLPVIFLEPLTCIKPNGPVLAARFILCIMRTRSIVDYLQARKKNWATAAVHRQISSRLFPHPCRASFLQDPRASFRPDRQRHWLDC